MRKVILIIALAFICAFVHAQDLVVSGNVNLVATNPVHVGITVNITFSVQNIGTATAGASYTGIYLSRTTNPSNGKLIGKISLEPLQSNAISSNIQFNFPVPYWLTNGGNYYVIVKLNDGQTITETNYSNNTADTFINVNHSPWAAQNIPYPIIFVHGYMSDNTTWNTLIDSLENFYGWSYGGNMDFCLNADQNVTTSNIATDYHDFTGESGHMLNVNPCDFYTINFAVNPDGSTPYNNKWESNQAAIVKQGRAVQDAIKHVLAITGKDRVILVCHSMGGLAAREYLQNSTLYQASDKKKHVAKLVTIGTPHGGTNIPASELGEIWQDYDASSEAVRDLRTSYLQSEQQGAYLFNGVENNDYMNDGAFSFNNVDVNCNGQTGDWITGINNKSIPTDLTYSCEIGLSNGGGGTTDGIVGPDQANLNNYRSVNADTFILREPYLDLNPIWHIEETKQFASIMRGMDEPVNDFDSGHAYSISSSQLYYGNLTAQSNSGGNSVRDYDGYTINVSANGNLNIQVYNVSVPFFSINVFNSSKTQIFNLDNHGKSYLSADVPVTKGSYYIVLSGVPNPDSYKYPYAFKCTFSTTTSYCSGTTNLTATSGTFNDGSGANVNYSNNCDCRWKIAPSGATSISLSFSAFKVSSPGDTVYAYDGSTTSSPLLGKWTGSTLPKKVTSKGGIMLVRFLTDAANTDAGWQASYTSVTVPVYCGTTTYTTASGVVSDGSGSNNYGNDSRCSWLITPEGAYTVTLNFTAFNTEASKDVLNVYDGNNDGAPLLGSFSGSSIPASITSSGGAMFLEFTTNDTITAAGWSAYYTSYAPYNNTGIVKYETWFDSNYTNKVTTFITPQDSFHFNSIIPTINLPTGLHSFNVRFNDNNNKWSSVMSEFFIKPPQTSGSNIISGYEYWFDSNYINKISQSVTGAENYQLLTNLNATSLSQGLHSFQIRFKDVGGVWSSVINQFFIKLPQSSGNNLITAYEYWFDNNDANEVSQGITGIQNYQLITNLNATSLLQGLHSFHIRFKDAGNAWSSVVNQFFVKTPETSGSNLVTAYEYWFDNNYAAKISQAVTGAQKYQLLKSVHAGTLSTGLHSFHIRFKDSSGAWSSTVNQFMIYIPYGTNTINRHEYWFDNDYVHKVYKVDTATSLTYTLNINAGASALSNGSHIFHIRFRQTNNLWSSVLSQSFTKTSTSQFASISLSSNQLTFTDNSVLFVYPNPNKGKFTIGIDDDANLTSIKIADGNGRLVYSNASLTKITMLQIDLSKYASGVYYIQATDGTKIYSKKFIVAK